MAKNTTTEKEINKTSEISEVNEAARLDEIENKIEAMLKAAEEKARKIIENASEEASSRRQKKADAALSDEVLAEIAKGEEYIEVTLFKDNDKYQDDVYVAVGNQNCVVKRGTPVKIKRKFYNAIKESAKNDLLTAQLIERESGEMKKIG